MKIISILKSAKFWAALAGIVTAISTAVSGDVTWAQALQAIAAIVIGYMAAKAHEDVGQAKAQAAKLSVLAGATDSKLAEIAKKLGLLVVVAGLLCSCLCPRPVCAQSIVPEGVTLGAAYAKSLHGNADAVIGKLSVGFAERCIGNGKTLAAALDLAAVPIDGKTKYGIGGSLTLADSWLGLSLGVAYLPEPYEWSWTVSIVQVRL